MQAFFFKKIVKTLVFQTPRRYNFQYIRGASRAGRNCYGEGISSHRRRRKAVRQHGAGTLGGHKGLKIYGRLDCPSALRYIAKGQYVKYRVFFKDEATAIAAGYRPCAVCMKEEYKRWKEKQKQAAKEKAQT